MAERSLISAILKRVGLNRPITPVEHDRTLSMIETLLLVSPPVGSVTAYAAETAPDGWLACEGQAILRADYPALFSVIGTRFGNTTGADFKVPDLRGAFVRGWANGSANDPDAASRTDAGGGVTGDRVGTKQTDATAKNGLVIADGAPSTNVALGSSSYLIDGSGPSASNAVFDTGNADLNHGHGLTGDNETRPYNVTMMYIIRFKY